METKMTLRDLAEGERGIVTAVTADSEMRRRLFDLGIVDGTVIECCCKSPFGDPVAYWVRGTLIALRNEDAQAVAISGEEILKAAQTDKKSLWRRLRHKK